MQEARITTTAKSIEDKMAMFVWNEYRKQILTRVGEIGKLSPDTVKGYTAHGGAGAKTRHLDAKIREVIALAVAIALRCDGCISVRTAAAKKLGAGKEEIAEALGSGSASMLALHPCTRPERLTHSRRQPDMNRLAKAVVRRHSFLPVTRVLRDRFCNPVRDGGRT